MVMRPTHPAHPGARLALWLVSGTLAYNVIEALIALWAGVSAESIALLGFGLDSLIEVAAACMLLWRLSLEARGADLGTIQVAEHRVHRFVGWTFFALALYVIAQASLSLWQREVPDKTFVGIALAATSLILMPLL